MLSACEDVCDGKDVQDGCAEAIRGKQIQISRNEQKESESDTHNNLSQIQGLHSSFSLGVNFASIRPILGALRRPNRVFSL
jgi:hypothetical protein